MTHKCYIECEKKHDLFSYIIATDFLAFHIFNQIFHGFSDNPSKSMVQMGVRDPN